MAHSVQQCLVSSVGLLQGMSAPKDAQASASSSTDPRPSASSTTTDKCSLREIMDQETEVRVMTSCVRIHSELAANAPSILIAIW